MQGLALTAMYLLKHCIGYHGSFCNEIILKARERGYFIMELPVYRMPRWKNVAFTMYDQL
jgi:ferrous iron transport protein B